MHGKSSRIRKSLELLVGSCCVYAIVAACAGSDFDGKGSSSGGSSAQGAGPGLGGKDDPTGGTNGTQEAGRGGIVDPVRPVHAQESGARLKARRLVSSDGASSFLGWYDAQREESCSFRVGTDGKTRCLPEGTLVVSIQYFADSSCSQPLARMNTCSSDAPYFLVVEETDDCAGTSKHSVRVRGEAFTGSTVYTKVSETCTPTANNYVSCSGTCYYPIGSEVPLSSFVALSEQIDD